MMNTRIATLHITTNPLFSPKPMNPCPTTAANTETVRSFFLPTRYMFYVGRQRTDGTKRLVIGIDLDQENRGESHYDIHNSDEDGDIGTQFRNHIGKDIIAVV